MKIKEKIKRIIEQDKQVINYEKDFCKELYKFEKGLVKVFLIVLLIECVFIGIKDCKPNTILKADTYSNIYNWEIEKTAVMEKVEYFGDVARIQFYANNDGSETSAFINAKITINNNRADNFRYMIASSKQITFVESTGSNIDYTIPTGAQTQTKINNVYVSGNSNVATANISKSTTNGYLNIKYQYTFTNISNVIYISYNLLTGTSTSNKELQIKWVYQQNEVYQKIDDEISDIRLSEAYNQGYNQGLADSEEGGIPAIMRTIFDYPIHFFNTLLDFNYKGFWVGQLFYVIVFLGLGFIIIKFLF